MFATLPLYLVLRFPNLRLILGTALVVVACGVTLTVLYHRYYSHRAYSLSKPAELVMLFFGTLIAQGSVLEWASDHRRHHKYVETELDPHAIVRGFWHAHILWIFERRAPLDEQLIRDLRQSGTLRFQHDHYTLLLVTSNVAVSLLLGWLSGDWLGGFYVGFLVRVFISHHCTFCINSLAHYWGSRPFDGSQTARNNLLCSLLTFGEGQHNYHHIFPNDYRIGDRWYHWDPGKWVIWTLSRLGLVCRLKRASSRAVAARRDRGRTQGRTPMPMEPRALAATRDPSSR